MGRGDKPKKPPKPKNGRGRPKDENVERHDCGKKVQKVARAIRERETKSVVVNARIRRGVPVELADKQEGGIQLVIMLAENGHKPSVIADYQIAAQEFERRWYAKCRFYPILRPRPPKNFYDPPGYDNDDGSDPEYQRAAIRANEEWKEVVWYVAEHGERDSLQTMLDVIVDNLEVKPELIGDIRSGLNAIKRMMSFKRNVA